VRDLIRQAAGSFAVDVLAYAVMSNHLHVVVRTDPARLEGWSAAEVAARWAAAHPRLGRDGVLRPWDAAEIAGCAADAAWVATARLRLRSLSWFMKAVKEQLARRANREDQCRGAFWEGRFRSVALLDQRALIAAMAYVDLNPIRAGLADRPERSDFTSIQDRCQARQAGRVAQALTASAPPSRPPGAAPAEEAGLWIAPILAATVGHRGEGPVEPIISLDDYLNLVDSSGRVLREGKAAIPATLAPILDRLRLDLDGWLTLMAQGGQLGQGSIGALASRAHEALRRGLRWITDRTTGLYRPDPGPALLA
jgi:REP element-mobilizing transposase RayT